MTASRASKLGLAVVCAAALAGCGHVQEVGASRTLDVAITEYHLKPDNIRVTAGYLDIHVHNFGRLTHNLVVSLGSQTAGSTEPIWPGQSVDLTVSLPPGTYALTSSMQSDEALGAYGTLKVVR